MKKYLFFLSLITLFMVGCSKDDVSYSAAPTINGEWKIRFLSMEGKLYNPGGQVARISTSTIGFNESDRVIFKDDYTYLNTSNEFEVFLRIGGVARESIIHRMVLDGLGNGTWSKVENNLVLTSNGDSTNYIVITLRESTLYIESSKFMRVSLEEFGDFEGTVKQTIILKR